MSCICTLNNTHFPLTIEMYREKNKIFAKMSRERQKLRSIALEKKLEALKEENARLKGFKMPDYVDELLQSNKGSNIGKEEKESIGTIMMTMMIMESVVTAPPSLARAPTSGNNENNLCTNCMAVSLLELGFDFQIPSSSTSNIASTTTHETVSVDLAQI